MDASVAGGDREYSRPSPRAARKPQQGEKPNLLSRFGVNAQGLIAWWTKVNNDWVFNMAGLLAYNFLMSVFPILLVLLAIAGFIIGGLAPAQQASFQSSLNGALPGGKTIVTAVTTELRHSAGILLILGLITAAFAGSRLFIVLESCFGIIFRLRSRNIIRQNLMAFGMLLLYMVLIPLIVLGSVIPSAILHALGTAAQNPVGAFLTQVLGILVSVAFAFIFVGAVFVVVPNRPVHIREVWKGTLVSAALLVLYNLLFPFYESMFLHPNNYGSVAGFAVVILVFFYYLGFIILIGAEVNSWANGQRETAGDLTALMHEVQAHDTTRGVAGPTAGLPQEDLQHSQGAGAMRDTEHALRHEREDHRQDVQPPKPAEAREPGPPHHPQQVVEQRWHDAAHTASVKHGDGRATSHSAQAEHAAASSQRSAVGESAGDSAVRIGSSTGSAAPSATTARPRLSQQGRQALMAVAITAGAAVAPAVAWLVRREPRHDDASRDTALDV